MSQKIGKNDQELFNQLVDSGIKEERAEKIVLDAIKSMNTSREIATGHLQNMFVAFQVAELDPAVSLLCAIDMLVMICVRSGVIEKETLEKSIEIMINSHSVKTDG